MASKFQNRLVGAVVLVAVGVIFLPALLDGDKKYNEDQFASIPLVPKPGDEQEIESIAPIEQTSVPSTPSEGASEGMLSEAVTGVEQSTVTTPESPAVVPVTPVEPPQQPTPTPESPTVVTPPVQPPTPPVQETKPPKGEAWVVQLGALKNAAKVEEIIAKMHFSGYPVYTIPARPVAGQVTRIYIGPSASKSELQAILPHLKELTGLQGEVRAYKP
ncbi:MULTISPECIES: cell division protein DedD [Proteus]|uniref:Cell division protein DedD n=1 Tax=Proteus penneri TaxID=102862 RepID=A0ABS0W4V3_9GAMM|nr:cell division protein DedD [Proteus penneri]EEG85975.1 sporulation and cell division repeat protein [Proteus penneri ATCC 35198]NBL78876.1 cell division protein DedD [Proteus sp. G2672]NBL91398.1 cell division protein DedD [Proteus sp. G2673]NBM04795.1 cell division protein DedD [Proteus sp. G2671]NBM13594.1 cell division protein DedD [Proteus sp. G2670]NBM33726.1 cell division protein DedD [Proteus sp. G2664]NBM49979.1 cell division protein DedD [Proteus sp. G2666]NBM60127.1 cell divisi